LDGKDPKEETGLNIESSTEKATPVVDDAPKTDVDATKSKTQNAIFAGVKSGALEEVI